MTFEIMVPDGRGGERFSITCISLSEVQKTIRGITRGEQADGATVMYITVSSNLYD